LSEIFQLFSFIHCLAASHTHLLPANDIDTTSLHRRTRAEIILNRFQDNCNVFALGDGLIPGSSTLDNFNGFGCTTGKKRAADEGEVEEAFMEFGGSEDEKG